MKKSFLSLFVLFVFVGCTDDGPLAPPTPPASNIDVTGGYTPEIDTSVGEYAGEMADDAAADTVGTDTAIYWEASSFTEHISVRFDGTSATIESGASLASTSIVGADVTIDLKTASIAGVEITASGTSTDGSLKIYSSEPVKLTLNGLTLTHTDGPALNIQSKKPTFIHLTEGTINTLCDGSSYADDSYYIASSTADNEDRKGCLFSEGNLIFSGHGVLQATGNKKHGIATDKAIVVRPGVTLAIKDAANHGIVGKDGVTILGGYIYSLVSSEAGKALKSDGNIDISSGKLMLYTTGGSIYDEEDQDTSSPACIKTDTNLTISGGWVKCLSTGEGGKGFNVDGSFTLSDGVVDVATSGGKYIYDASLDLDSSPKGIKADGEIVISGGKLNIQVVGVSDGSEGLESKSKITIDGGEIFVYAYDDAINVGDDAPEGLVINGGKVFAFADNNDGIDSNGKLHINGGVVITSGSAAPEEGFDCDSSNNFVITGGTLIGTGGAAISPSSSSTQCSVIYNGIAATTDALVAILDADQQPILLYRLPRSMNSLTLFFSSPAMTSNQTYTLYSGGSLSDNSSNWNGLFVDGTYTTGTSLGSFTTSSVVTTVGSSGGPGGGPGNGGGFGPGWW